MLVTKMLITKMLVNKMLVTKMLVTKMLVTKMLVIPRAGRRCQGRERSYFTGNKRNGQERTIFKNQKHAQSIMLPNCQLPKIRPFNDFKLLVYITLQVVKTEYYPCDFHFLVLNMTNEAQEDVCVLGFRLGMDWNISHCYNISITGLIIFSIKASICLFKVG